MQKLLLILNIFLISILLSKNVSAKSLGFSLILQDNEPCKLEFLANLYTKQPEDLKTLFETLNDPNITTEIGIAIIQNAIGADIPVSMDILILIATRIPGFTDQNYSLILAVSRKFHLLFRDPNTQVIANSNMSPDEKDATRLKTLWDESKKHFTAIRGATPDQQNTYKVLLLENIEHMQTIAQAALSENRWTGNIILASFRTYYISTILQQLYPSTKVLKALQAQLQAQLLDHINIIMSDASQALASNDPARASNTLGLILYALEDGIDSSLLSELVKKQVCVCLNIMVAACKRQGNTALAAEVEQFINSY